MIALYKGTSNLSRAIRFINWSQYSHASYISPEGWEIEAWKGGVRSVSALGADHTPGTEVDLFDTGISFSVRRYIEKFLHEQLCKAYDWASVLHFITRRPEESEDQVKWFCSELVFAAFLEAGNPLLSRIPAYKVYPGMISYSPLLKHIATVTVKQGGGIQCEDPALLSQYLCCAPA